MFQHDKSLSCVEVNSEDIIALYRSTSVAPVTVADFKSRPCNAFICVAQEGNIRSVYVALCSSGARGVLVFTPGAQSRKKADHEKVLQEALTFTGNMGFSMETVNLDYSKALREVVISDTRVIRPAKTVRRGVARKTTHDKVAPEEHSENDSSKKPEGSSASEEVVSSSENNAEVQTTVVDIPLTEIELDKMREELRKADATRLEKQGALEAELERLVAEKKEHEKASTQKLAEAKNHVKKLRTELAAQEEMSAGQLTALRAEVERLAEEKAASERASAEQLAAARADVDRLVAEKVEIEQLTSARLAAARDEAALLAEEKVAVETACAGELDSLRAEVERYAAEKAALEKEAGVRLAEAREKVQQLSAEKTALAATVAEEQAALFAESSRLEQEKATLEETSARETAAAREKMAQCDAEKSAVQRAVGEQMAAIRAETERLAAERRSVEMMCAAELAAAGAELKKVIGAMAATVTALTGRLAEVQAEADRFLSGIVAGIAVAEDQAEAERVSADIVDETAAADDEAGEEEKTVAEELAVETILPEPPVVIQEFQRLELPEEVEVAHAPGLETVVAAVATVEESEPTQAEESKTGGVSVEEALAALAGEGLTSEAAPPDENAAEGGRAESEEDDCIARSLEALVGNDWSSSVMGAASGLGSSLMPGGASSGHAVQFSLDKTIPAISFGSMEEIVEIHQSLNIARITPEGNIPKSCKAYICAIKKSGAVSVNIGLQQTDNNRVLIYTPEEQPKSSDFRGTVQSAIDFLESAGFLMDPLPLENDQRKMRKLLAGIAVLRGNI